MTFYINFKLYPENLKLFPHRATYKILQETHLSLFLVFFANSVDASPRMYRVHNKLNLHPSNGPSLEFYTVSFFFPSRIARNVLQLWIHVLRNAHTLVILILVRKHFSTQFVQLLAIKSRDIVLVMQVATLKAPDRHQSDLDSSHSQTAAHGTIRLQVLLQQTDDRKTPGVITDRKIPQELPKPSWRPPQHLDEEPAERAVEARQLEIDVFGFGIWFVSQSQGHDALWGQSWLRCQQIAPRRQ